MANSERGYETRADNLQGFDLSMNMDSIDEPSRLPLLVVVALIVLAAFAGVVWLAYTQGVERGRASVSRELIAREVWKIRKTNVPPYTGLTIYDQAAAGDRRSKATSAPGRIAANAIPALRPSATANPDTLPTPQTGDAPPRTAAIPAKSRSDFRSAGETPAVPGNPSKPAPQHVATRAPTDLVKPAAAPPTHPITSLDSPPLQQVPAEPASSPTPPSSTPAPTAAPSAPAQSPAPAAMSGIVLQIGSYKSETEARQSWSAFRTEHDATAGYRPDVKAVDLGAKGTWYRLRMGPFADKKSAMTVCAKLKADGASCLLAR